MQHLQHRVSCCSPFQITNILSSHPILICTELILKIVCLFQKKNTYAGVSYSSICTSLHKLFEWMRKCWLHWKSDEMNSHWTVHWYTEESKGEDCFLFFNNGKRYVEMRNHWKKKMPTQAPTSSFFLAAILKSNTTALDHFVALIGSRHANVIW